MYELFDIIVGQLMCGTLKNGSKIEFQRMVPEMKLCNLSEMRYNFYETFRTNRYSLREVAKRTTEEQCDAYDAIITTILSTIPLLECVCYNDYDSFELQVTTAIDNQFNKENN